MATATAAPTAPSILAELKSKANEPTRKTYVRHGMPADRVLGVKIADLKPIARRLRGQQQLALELYKSGVMDAMYLAGMIADGAKMTRRELDAWAKGASGLGMIAESTVPAVTVENPAARELALAWMKSKDDSVASCGWNTYGGILATMADEELDLKEIEALLATVVKSIHTANNRERYSMNVFVISVGGYVKPLLAKAKAAAKQIGAVEVDVGDTACQIPQASAYIAKIEAAGRIGKKRTTMKC